MQVRQSQSNVSSRAKTPITGDLFWAEMARPSDPPHAQQLAGGCQRSMASPPALLKISKVQQPGALSSRTPCIRTANSFLKREQVHTSLAARVQIHFIYVQRVALPGCQWASLWERRFRRMRLEGHTAAPVAAFSLRAASDTHTLPPLLSVPNSPCPQLSPLLVSVTYLVTLPKSSFLRDLSP